MTHSFVRQKTHAAAPTWVQEGLAQWMEGKRVGPNAAALLRIYDAKQAISLVDLEAPWLKMPNETAGYAYAWALANIEFIVQVDGMTDIERILDHLREGMPTEAALKMVLRDDYSDLMDSTAQYLRKTYADYTVDLSGWTVRAALIWNLH